MTFALHFLVIWLGAQTLCASLPQAANGRFTASTLARSGTGLILPARLTDSILARSAGRGFDPPFAGIGEEPLTGVPMDDSSRCGRFVVRFYLDTISLEALPYQLAPFALATPYPIV